VKQFTRCANCRQWYVHTFTTTVEIYHGGHLCRVAEWCLRCIDEAEQRSQPVDDGTRDTLESRLMVSASPEQVATKAASVDSFEQLVQEHLDLMTRAIHEDDAVIIPLIEDFMQRCRIQQQRLKAPEPSRRLLGHMQYWEAFLKALQQSH
jgi:hypothetical protein